MLIMQPMKLMEWMVLHRTSQFFSIRFCSTRKNSFCHRMIIPLEFPLEGLMEKSIQLSFHIDLRNFWLKVSILWEIISFEDYFFWSEHWAALCSRRGWSLIGFFFHLAYQVTITCFPGHVFGFWGLSQLLHVVQRFDLQKICEESYQDSLHLKGWFLKVLPHIVERWEFWWWRVGG